MDLDNRTPFHARLFRTAIDDDRLAASVAVRITYDIKGDEAIISENQIWPVSSEPWETEYGVFDTDQLFYRGGVDLFLFGTARPATKDTSAMKVSVRVADFLREIVIFGPRVWHKRISGLVATSPRPIEAIPLKMAFAYGGKDIWDGLDVPYPLNPDGIGFYLNEHSAVDRPLPLIEEPDQLVTKWDDRPNPAGVAACPPGSPVRLNNLWDTSNPQNPKFNFDARFYNAAHPKMIVQVVKPGDYVNVAGVMGSGMFRFRIPDKLPQVHLKFDGERASNHLKIDQVGIESDKQRIFISYRFPFRYIVIPEQLRTCTLEY